MDTASAPEKASTDELPVERGGAESVGNVSATPTSSASLSGDTDSQQPKFGKTSPTHSRTSNTDQGQHTPSPCFRKSYLDHQTESSSDGDPEEQDSAGCLAWGHPEPKVKFYVLEDYRTVGGATDPELSERTSQDPDPSPILLEPETTNERHKVLQTTGTVPVLLRQQASEEEEEDPTKADKPAAPDGGWGWMVVLGCAVMHFAVGGYSRSFGVIFIKLQEKFDSSAALTAWVGGLCTACRFMAGTYISYLQADIELRLS